jgi:hypothetical protein
MPKIRNEENGEKFIVLFEEKPFQMLMTFEI